ncbi:MAG: DNA repair protein RadC [Thermodesulfovibrionales bacterium]|nr:DNA repair protein RadC [Thermodesulfovibrionales bacterium]
MNKIKEMPENERPRERLLNYGAGSLSEAQLLAIIIRTGSGNKNAITLAMELLNKFGSLNEIEKASLNEFKDIKGLGMVKVAQIKASLELGKRLISEKSDFHVFFHNSKAVFEYLLPKLKGIRQEKFICLILDVKNRLLKEHEVTTGILNESLIHPREAFREAIKEAGASVIFVHNHPSGDPEPSPKDLAITDRLCKTGDIIGIKVLDHIIIAEDCFASMKERGLL